MLMTATLERLPEDTAVVTFSGQLTMGTSLKVADAQVQAAIEDGVSKMVFDLTNVEFVDSAGLGMVMCAYGAINDKGGAFRLCGVAQRVLSLFKITNTDRFLAIDASLEDSLAALKQ